MSRVFVGLLAGVVADSISNCGGSSDHIAVTSIVLDADASGGPRKGKAFNIIASGVLDKAHQHGTVVIDANLKALGIVNEPVALTQKYDFLPGLAAGPASITIGPFTFPRSIPGELDFNGKITIVDENEEPTLCLDLALKIPKILDEVSLEVESKCAQTDSDHITNFQNPDNQTLTMDLDEDMDFVNLGVDISVKVPLLPAVNVKLTELPIAFSPAIPAGQILFRGLDAASAYPNFMSVITVGGSLQLSDKNGDQLTCIVLDDASAISV